MKIDKKYYNKNINLIIKTQQEIDRYYRLSIDDLAKQISKNSWESGKSKAFKKYMKRWQSELNADMQLNMQTAIDDSWLLGEQKAIAYNEYYYGSKVVAQELIRPSKEALAAFTKRKIKGLTWSENVWNMAKGSNKLVEDYVATGVLKGQSARNMSKDILDMMRNPAGTKVPVELGDGETVLRSFKSQSAYLQTPPLPGQYKNPFKAIMRMARTETNASYLSSDFHQIQNQRFVVGRRVKLSAAHADSDICDTLAGDYPKTFIFEGWHPNCLCYAVSIRMTKEEFRRGGAESKNTVTQIPKSTERLAKAIKEGKMGSPSMKDSFWLRDNFTADGTPYKKVGGTTGVSAYKNKKDLAYTAPPKNYEKNAYI